MTQGEDPVEDHNHTEQALLIKDNLVVTVSGVYGKNNTMRYHNN